MDHLSNTQLVSIIAPIVLLQVVLMIIALVVCIRAEETNGPRWMWLLIIVCGSLIGSILFFIIGRRSTSS
ncbi:PLD nuclease N-terminal domain-containing protein [Paenibacillus sp. GCM10027626]|uniref:PLD nuclease N-terminal domain-containing protein n=1 Tax=Paenibacillus sp. GCM10027626 TaxID=3273411 RepID=UPI003626BF78